jgi:sigma-B regulation protein RsbU (phosphoserine phosphatase)
LLYTDGVTEAFNTCDEQFGKKRLIEHLSRHRAASPPLLLEQLFAAVRDFAAGSPIQDDMTAVAVQALSID